MRKPLVRSWSAARSRLLVLLAIQMVSLPVAGCADAAPPSPAAPPQPPPPAASAAPADMPAAPPPPSAPGHGPMDAPAAAPATMHASLRQPASAPRAGSPRPPAAPGKAPPPPGKVAVATPPPPPGRTAEKAPAPAAPAGPVAPLLIYVGTLTMQVDESEIAPTLDKVIDLAESLGGYLAGRKDGSVEVRVPSARFREGLTALEKFGEVLHRSVTADDVSEQYNDLEVRLVNLKATRQRLQEFLAKAANVGEALQVAHELERVAGEMEQIEGKMRFLRSRAAFSLVTVNVSARPKQIPKVVETPPVPPPREVDLPIDWLTRIGLGRLLNLRAP